MPEDLPDNPQPVKHGSALTRFVVGLRMEDAIADERGRILGKQIMNLFNFPYVGAAIGRILRVDSVPRPEAADHEPTPPEL